MESGGKSKTANSVGTSQGHEKRIIIIFFLAVQITDFITICSNLLPTIAFPCYLYVHKYLNASFQNASDICKNLGADLWCPESWTTYELIWNTLSTTKNQNFWLGLMSNEMLDDWKCRNQSQQLMVFDESPIGKDPGN